MLVIEKNPLSPFLTENQSQHSNNTSPRKISSERLPSLTSNNNSNNPTPNVNNNIAGSPSTSTTSLTTKKTADNESLDISGSASQLTGRSTGW